MAKYLLSLFLLLVPFSAHAMDCGPRDAIIKMLAKEHNEAVVARGLAGGGAMIELYRKKGGQTWTILGTAPSSPDVTCIITDGESWSPVEFNLITGERS